MLNDWHIQDVVTRSQALACVRLQERIWGEGFDERVPAAILWIARRTGGVVAAAFHDDEAVGFVFGITGWVAGRPFHWSDMLAVDPEWQGRGLGVALKRYQRRRLEQADVPACSWTFDPLDARNAYLNFAKFGATAREYVPDAYGASNSKLHVGLSTDRLVVSWAPASPRVRGRMEDDEAPPDDPGGAVINPAPGTLRLDLEDEWLRLRLPADIHDLRRNDLAAARQWRADTREALQRYFSAGFEVCEMVPEPEPVLLLRRQRPALAR